MRRLETRLRAFGVAVPLFVALGVPHLVYAVPLNYIFVGTTSGGSTLDLGLGAGPESIAGLPYTATGMTLDDIDLSASSSFGAFAAMTTYTFGAFGSFTTDASTGETYFQGCSDSVSITCVGLSDSAVVDGFRIDIPLVAADPNAGGAPIGGPIAATGGGQSTRVLTNLSGQTLVFVAAGGFGPSSVTANAKPVVPEPSALLLLGTGLVVAAYRRGPKQLTTAGRSLI